MTSSLLTVGTWPYGFMNKLSPAGLFMFFGISFLLYIAMYYIGKILSHLQWGGQYPGTHVFIVTDALFYRTTETCERRLTFTDHSRSVVFIYYNNIYNNSQAFSYMMVIS